MIYEILGASISFIITILYAIVYKGKNIRKVLLTDFLTIVVLGVLFIVLFMNSNSSTESRITTIWLYSLLLCLLVNIIIKLRIFIKNKKLI